MELELTAWNVRYIKSTKSHRVSRTLGLLFTKRPTALKILYRISRDLKLPVMVIWAVLAQIHLALKLQVWASRNIPVSVIFALWNTFLSLRKGCPHENGWIFGKFLKGGGGSFPIQKISLHFFCIRNCTFGHEFPKAVWNFSKNSSIMERTGVPYSCPDPGHLVWTASSSHPSF